MATAEAAAAAAKEAKRVERQKKRQARTEAREAACLDNASADATTSAGASCITISVQQVVTLVHLKVNSASFPAQQVVTLMKTKAYRPCFEDCWA